MNRNIQMKTNNPMGTIVKIEKKIGNKILRYAQMKVNGITTQIYVGSN